jgi:uncharacterized protein (DUF433 family)
MAFRHCRRPFGCDLRQSLKRIGVTGPARCGMLSAMRDYREIITLVPGQRSGKPTVRGMRITVADVLGYLAAGMSEDEILADFPELTRDDLRACLAFAAERERTTIEG